MSRIMYQLTEKDLKKAAQFAQMAEDKRAWADSKKKKLGKRYGLECREAARQALKGDPEYQRGIWQGRIDAANDFDYSEERNEAAYNMGYYNGYTNYRRDLRGGLVIPAQYLIEGEQ